MLSLLRQFWKTLLAISGLVGIVYLYPDIRDLPETYPYLAWAAEMERETALLIFSLILVGYVAWIDARPFLRRYFSRHTIVCGRVECLSFSFKNKGEHFFLNRYYLPIVNAHPEGKTIKGVKCFVHTPFDVLPTEFLHEGRAVDLNSGEKALVQIGEFIAREPFGLFKKGDTPDDKMMEDHLINAPRGFYTFYLYCVGLALTKPTDEKEASTFHITFQVVGENVKSKLFELSITHKEGVPKLTVKDYLGQSFEPHSLVDTAKEMRRKTRLG